MTATNLKLFYNPFYVRVRKRPQIVTFLLYPLCYCHYCSNSYLFSINTLMTRAFEICFSTFYTATHVISFLRNLARELQSIIPDISEKDELSSMLSYYTYIVNFFFGLISVLRPPLWSSGQSFWLQIQRSRVRFPALPDFLSSSGSGTGSTQPREIN